MAPLTYVNIIAYMEQQRVSFSKGIHTSKTILEYGHANLWEPENTPAVGHGTGFFLSILDDYSRRV